MDELLIEDKKYISSKQAAKLTGYAKDYIGQLCREGRVPARLVGRSWYVLETAIQDHRFGASTISSVVDPIIAADQTLKEQMNSPVAPASSIWSAPRYSESVDNLLPPINYLRKDNDVSTENIDDNNKSFDLDDSWRTWFDRVADAETKVPIVKKKDIEEVSIDENTPPSEPNEISININKQESNEDMSVPIHSVYIQPPQELLPRNTQMEIESIEASNDSKVHNPANGGNRIIVRAVQSTSILFGVIAVLIVLAGSGYLDKYIISAGPASIIAGISLYNK